MPTLAQSGEEPVRKDEGLTACDIEAERRDAEAFNADRIRNELATMREGTVRQRWRA